VKQDQVVGRYLVDDAGKDQFIDWGGEDLNLTSGKNDFRVTHWKPLDAPPKLEELIEIRSPQAARPGRPLQSARLWHAVFRVVLWVLAGVAAEKAEAGPQSLPVSPVG
jgi:hypothetical protein